MEVEDYDGAEPSGNSVGTLSLLRLAAMTDNSDYAEAAEKTLLEGEGAEASDSDASEGDSGDGE